MSSRSTPARFRHLPTETVVGREVPVAESRWVRLLGLALLSGEVAGPGLLIPDCRSIHTFGMRFLIDVYFLDARGAVISRRLAVPHSRLLRCRRAVAVLEVPCRGER